MPLPRFRRRWLLAGGLVVLLAVGGTAVWAATRPATSTAATTTTSLVAATTTTLRQTIATTGTVAYATTSDQSFTVGGTVTSVPVSVGEKVHTGQVLATADSAALASALAQANSTLAAAQAKVASDTAASSTQLAADEASVSAAQAAVAAAQADLSKATLTSPIDGTVSALTLTAGQQLGSTGAAAGGSGSGGGASSGGASSGGSGGSGGAASSSGTSSAQVEVVSTGHYVVDATVDDTEVGRLTAGETAGITLADGSVTSGTVTSVGIVASSTSGVASFPVVVTVAGTPTGLYPGSVLPVVVVTKTVPDALAVPVAALHRTASGTTVTVDKNGTRTARTVSTGLVSGGQVQITDGLTAGEKVVVTSVRVTAPAGTQGTTRTGARTGGFGGGSFGGGGFGGGGFGGGGGGFRGAGGGGN
ncbi:MAG: efflux RND transporter periplasmic adaptor subunit [Mycobacteriales bacterium]